MICCLNHWSFIKDPFDCNVGSMFTLPTARFQVWILANPSWRAPIWILLRRLEYDWTNQHSLKRKRVELHQSFCAMKTGRLHWSWKNLIGLLSIIFCRLGRFLSKCCLWAPSPKSQRCDKRYIRSVRVTWPWWRLLLESKGVTWVRKT